MAIASSTRKTTDRTCKTSVERESLTSSVSSTSPFLINQKASDNTTHGLKVGETLKVAETINGIGTLNE